MYVVLWKSKSSSYTVTVRDIVGRTCESDEVDNFRHCVLQISCTSLFDRPCHLNR